MIENIVNGDITSPENDAHIIIGMNAELADVRGIGLPFVKNIHPMYPITLGSVLSFEYDHTRILHMIICHHLGHGGWVGAHKFVRYGLDHLRHPLEVDQGHYSIVEIGTGRVGKRDGANPAEIRTEMANSFLSVDLYIYDPDDAGAAYDVVRAPLRPLWHYHPTQGEEILAA